MTKLNIKNEMAQLDLKNREFYDQLTDEERKQFSTFTMIRWGSCVTNASREIQEYYVCCANEVMNKHYFDIAKHPKLQWLTATAISPGIGTRTHQWIAKPKNAVSNNKIMKFLREIHPHLKEDELDLLRQLNTTNDFKQLAKQHGWPDDRIKSYF